MLSMERGQGVRRRGGVQMTREKEEKKKRSKWIGRSRRRRRTEEEGGWESISVKMHPQHICKSLAVEYREWGRERRRTSRGIKPPPKPWTQQRPQLKPPIRKVLKLIQCNETTADHLPLPSTFFNIQNKEKTSHLFLLTNQIPQKGQGDSLANKSY